MMERLWVSSHASPALGGRFCLTRM
jgi:hypothetical protein